MKHYFEKLAADYDRVLEFLCSPKGEAGLKKIDGKLIPGARAAWCYEDEVKFWKEEGIEEDYRNPERWPYQGFIIPFPETDGRNEMEVEHVCVVVTDYPIEKENPVADWAVLAVLFELGDLHRFHVFSEHNS